MRVLDLFSGIGGFSLGLERAGMTTVAFCEQDKFCQQVLKKHWPDIPIYDDVRTLDGKQFRGTVDIVCGGFPCQPFSVAGQQKGKADERHLWPEMLRIIKESKPTWVIGENVGGFVNMALDDCWADLEAEGYEVQPFIIPACSVEAHHRRDRCWIVAYHEKSSDGAYNTESMQRQKQEFREGNSAAAVANSTGGGRQGQGRDVQPCNTAKGGNGEAGDADNGCEGNQTDRLTKPRLGGDSDGLPDWLDGFEYIGNPDRFGTPRVTTRKDNRANRLKALGNAVVPQIPEIIGRAIMNINKREVIV